jgi:DNA-binding NarL/FixJ family response regulator
MYSPREQFAHRVELELANQADMDLVGAGSTAGGALLLANQSDVLLLPYALPDDLLAMTIAAVRSVTRARVVVIEAPSDAELQERLYEHGVSGCLTSNRPPHELVEAVRFVANDGVWIEPTVLRSALNRIQQLSARYRQRRAA